MHTGSQASWACFAMHARLPLVPVQPRKRSICCSPGLVSLLPPPCGHRQLPPTPNCLLPQKADIWSCGVALYALVTNELPFRCAPAIR